MLDHFHVGNVQTLRCLRILFEIQTVRIKTMLDHGAAK
jgi:hypothetical protein